jgi:hypothetical protein
MYLISGEIGFIGSPAPNPNLVYENFIDLTESIVKRVKIRSYDDINCSFYSKTQKESFDFEVDYDKDWRLVFELVAKIKVINNMCGSVCNTAVSLNVDAIYEFIGSVFMQDDEYFEVLKALWKDFILTNPSDEKIESKITELKNSFDLTDERLAELKSL